MGKLIFGKPIDVPAGTKPTHAYGNSVRNHHGIDYPAHKGTNIVASERGVVVKAGFNGSTEKKQFGNVIIIDHTPKAADNEPHLYTVYGHLRDKKIEVRPFAVKVGDMVNKGRVIGYCGNTGKSTGPHLHFAVAHLSKKAKWMSPGDGPTGINPYEYTDPNKYIGHIYKLNGTLNDLTEKEAERLINDKISYRLDYRFGKKFRMAVLVDGVVKDYIDAKNKSVTVKLKYDENELEKLMTSPMLPPKKNTPLDINISVKL